MTWKKLDGIHRLYGAHGATVYTVRKDERDLWSAYEGDKLVGTRNARGTAMRLCENLAMIKAQVTAAARTRAESDARWWYDVDKRQVRDENGLVVVDLFPSPGMSNAQGETIAAAPHALYLVSRMERLLGGIVSGDVGSAWKERARELCNEARALIAAPGSSACITNENAGTFTQERKA